MQTLSLSSWLWSETRTCLFIRVALNNAITFCKFFTWCRNIIELAYPCFCSTFSTFLQKFFGSSRFCGSSTSIVVLIIIVTPPHPWHVERSYSECHRELPKFLSSKWSRENTGWLQVCADMLEINISNYYTVADVMIVNFCVLCAWNTKFYTMRFVRVKTISRSPHSNSPH